jgi:PII-like signaling protein
MSTPTGPAACLRIYTHETAREDHRPLYEAIVLKAREAKIAGVTVLRGPMGYGRSAHLRNAMIIDLSADLPLMIEMVDAETALRAFLPTLTAMKAIGLITLEAVEVVHAPSASDH